MKITLDKVQGLLLILLAFFMPISVFITDLLIFTISIIWVFQGELKNKWQIISSSKWMLSVIALFSLYLIGLLWGNYHSNASWTLEKTALLLFLPILYSSNFSQKTIRNSVIAFLSAMTLSSILAILINHKTIPRLAKMDKIFSNSYSMSSFMQYNYHNLFLAFALLLCLIIIFRIVSSNYKVFVVSCALLMITSLYTEPGRAGHLLFICITFFFTFYLFAKNKLALFGSILSICIMLFISYHYSADFNRRVQATYTNVLEFDVSKENSISTRYNLAKYSIQKIKEKPLLGHGTGSFVEEFSSMGDQAIASLQSQHKTPHNNFLFVFFELGIVGLILLLLIFYYQITEYSSKSFSKVRILFPVLFLLLMWSDSFFQNHNSAILYVFLSLVFSTYSSK
jgi:O-antigen ligase